MLSSREGEVVVYLMIMMIGNIQTLHIFVFQDMNSLTQAIAKLFAICMIFFGSVSSYFVIHEITGVILQILHI